MYWLLTEDPDGAIQRVKVAHKSNYYGTKIQCGITTVPERTSPVVFIRWDEGPVFFTTPSKLAGDLVDGKTFQRWLWLHSTPSSS